MEVSVIISEVINLGIYLAFMFESSMMFTITDYAMNRSGKLHGWLILFPPDRLMSIPVHDVAHVGGQFMNHIARSESEMNSTGRSDSEEQTCSLQLTVEEREKGVYTLTISGPYL